MIVDQAAPRCQRLFSEDGPILLWPSRAEERWGLLLDVNVCPFPGCPERHVIVDGFLVENLRRSLVRPGRRSTPGDGPEEGEPDWAFVVSVDIDAPGEVHVEKCRDGEALSWFSEALDDELRAALLRRFERRRAEFDAALGDRDPAARGSMSAVTVGRAGWSAEPIPPDRLGAVMAAFERGIRTRRTGETAPGRSRTPRTGRNDPCPCGSGRKYKKCCLGSA